MVSKTLRFYLIRLRRASMAEMVHRLKEALLVSRLSLFKGWRRRATLAPSLNPDLIRRLALPDIVRFPDNSGTVIESAASRNFLNHDPDTLAGFEKRWQGVFYSKVKIKSVDPDIRAVWEPARLQHLAANLYDLNEHPDRPDAVTLKGRVADALLDWIETNPFLMGPHYMSVMECGLRIPVFFLALKVLDNLTTDQIGWIGQTIYEHAWITFRRLSTHSSRGNHTVAECLGLLAAGLMYEDHLEGRKWLNTAVATLRAEALHQIRPDGGPLEQSFGYHRFVLDLFWLALGFLEKNGRPGLNDIKPRLILGEEFLRSSEAANMEYPAIGDSDDGFAVAPGYYPARAEVGEGQWESLESEQGNIRWRTYEDSGYTVIRTSHEGLLVFDHSPLGMPPLYNHGHADALSLILFKNNRPMLVDPGTFRYNQASNLRRYFKSTRAHNTVVVDRQDQAVQETGFIWSHPYKAELVKRQKSHNGFMWEASHDGYTRLAEPVWHKRAVYLLSGQVFVVRDRFGGRGEHEFEINFHLHPDARVELDQDWWLIDNAGERVFITQLNNDDFDLVKGRKNPRLGWYSAGYNLMDVAPALHKTAKGSPQEVSFVTVICAAEPVDSETLEHMVASI